MSNTMSAGEARALLGAWQQIVGAAEAQGLMPAAPQQAAVPTNLHHGASGGHHGHRGHGHRGMGGYAEYHGLHLPPRNYITEMDPPEFARREALPLNSGNVTVPQQGTLVITSRPQRPAFRPERLFISGPVGSTVSGETAAAWLVNDVSIGNKSQLAQAGQLPGDMFANLSIDSFVSFDTVQTAMDVTLSVQYVGGSDTQVSFVGGMLGTSAVHG